VKVAAMAPGSVKLNSFSWNRRLVRYVKLGNIRRQSSFSNKCNKKERILTFTFVLVLYGCASSEALEDGWQAHEEIIQSGCEADPFVGE
jgi:hypothetical protein